MLGSRAHTVEGGAHKYGIGKGKKEPYRERLELELSDELMMSKREVCVYKSFYA